MYAYIVSYLQSHTSSFNIHACIFALMANNKQNNSNNSNNHNKSNNCETNNECGIEARHSGWL